MKEVRLGIVGLGNMGGAHAENVLAGKVPRLRLAAVADETPSKLAAYSEVKRFENAGAMIASGEIDAILIATPHYSHTTIGIDALNAGLHVLVEKPISVHKADCEKLISAHRSGDQVFAAMFNQRTDLYYIKLRELIQNGELGEIRRAQWTITNWFRTHMYYASGGWRATWGGEGGGVLLNQCPHNLDLWYWFFGRPSRVRAFCHISRYHDIEVEDDVTAYMEYANGMHGTFITSTGEAPGTNRLEVVGERGRVVIEDDKFLYTRNEIPMSEFSKTVDALYARPAVWNVEIPISGHGGQHVEILRNFTAAILDNEPLIAPAGEGIHSVELANAMLLSSSRGQTIEMPLDGGEYEAWLQKKIADSTFVKKTIEIKSTDFSLSFAH